MDETPHTPPQFTQHRLFWPLIALIALLFVVTMAMAVNAANRAATLEATNVGSCAPAFLRQYDTVDDSSAVLPTLPLGDSVDALLDQLAPTDATTAGACAAP
ncbi:MAG: hypothetical protein SNJ54_15870 [Anaerolineae bacterium]